MWSFKIKLRVFPLIRRPILFQRILQQILLVCDSSLKPGAINVLACLYQDVFPMEGMMRLSVMEQCAFVWTKKEKKSLERGSIGISLSTARGHLYLHLVMRVTVQIVTKGKLEF